MPTSATPCGSPPSLERWVAIPGGFLLDGSNIQTFERKPQEPKPEEA